MRRKVVDSQASAFYDVETGILSGSSSGSRHELPAPRTQKRGDTECFLFLVQNSDFRIVSKSITSLIRRFLKVAVRLLGSEFIGQVVEFLVGDSLSRVEMFEHLSIDSRARLADLLRPCRFPISSEIFCALDVGA